MFSLWIHIHDDMQTAAYLCIRFYSRCTKDSSFAALLRFAILFVRFPVRLLRVSVPKTYLRSSAATSPLRRSTVSWMVSAVLLMMFLYTAVASLVWLSTGQDVEKD